MKKSLPQPIAKSIKIKDRIPGVSPITYKTILKCPSCKSVDIAFRKFSWHDYYVSEGRAMLLDAVSTIKLECLTCGIELSTHVKYKEK